MELIAASMMLVASILGCYQAPNDFDAPNDIAYEQEAEEPQEEAVEEPQEEGYEDVYLYEAEAPQQDYYVEQSSGYVEEAGIPEQAPVYSGGLTPQSGVNYYDGRTETYYSSNVLYHYRTGEWTVDDEGFYRTDDGYYVVAASDMEQGTVFETSKGTAIVLDSGCSNGVTDFYVNW